MTQPVEHDRCTNTVFREITGRFATETIWDGGHLLEALCNAGFTYGIEYNVPKTVRALLADSRFSTGTWYFFTSGHALAVINGRLIDTEDRGADGRRVRGVFPIRRSA